MLLKVRRQLVTARISKLDRGGGGKYLQMHFFLFETFYQKIVKSQRESTEPKATSLRLGSLN